MVVITNKPIVLGSKPQKKSKGLLGFLKKGVTPQGRFAGRLVTGKTTKKERKSEAKKFAKGLGISAAIIGGGTLAAANPALAGRAAAGLARGVGKTAFGSPTRAGLTILGAGALSTSPTLRRAAARTPQTLFKTGKKLGLEAEKQREQSDKIPKTLTAGLAGAGLGLIAPSAFEKFKDIIARRKESVQFRPLPSSFAGAVPASPQQAIPTDASGVSAVPVASETEELLTEKAQRPKRKRRKTRSKPFSQKISQSVRINIDQRKSKRYIRQKIYN